MNNNNKNTLPTEGDDVTSNEVELPELATNKPSQDKTYVVEPAIDLPDATDADFNLPDINNFDLDLENDLLTVDTMERDVDNALMMGVDEPRQPDFTKKWRRKMALTVILNLNWKI